jgi:glycosyltransferase involved in cell wall biosynthesis
LTDTAARGDKAGVLVFTSVFPNSAQPGLGLFVRERMFRLARVRPLVVVAPVPWFPLQSLIRLRRPHFRPTPPRRELQDGIEVLHPRFLSVPGTLKWLDGLSMALASLRTLRRLRRRFDFRVIDAHFAYPDGLAAVLLGRWLGLPVSITLRGTEVPLARFPWRRRQIVAAVNRAARVFTVADSLGRHVGTLGARTDHVLRVGNGVDGTRFFPEDRAASRARLDLPEDAPVLVSVGALCERKGFHRVLEVLPGVLAAHPGLHYLVVGGANPEGDWSGRLREQARALGLERRVHFLGRLPPEHLRGPLSAADLFVLATRNEGWANVFLEAMACGLPVVTTDVGGNAEVVCRPELGTVVPFGDAQALARALDEGLSRQWDRDAILGYARENDWSQRVEVLDGEFARLGGEG